MHSPLFCPNRRCPFHSHTLIGFRWWVKDGHYPTLGHGRIQRFKCRFCHTSCSDQTFSIRYAEKIRIPYKRLFELLCRGAGIRGIARALKVSHQLILNRVSRLARQALAIHSKLLAQLSLSESLVADGFESFVGSQYFPNNIHLLAGQRSQFLYAFDYAHLKRKGRMSEEQRIRRDQLWERFISGRRTISGSFSCLIEVAEQLIRGSSEASVQLITDEKPEYRRIINRSKYLSDLRHSGTFSHLRVSSQKARTKQNRLFSVNYLDREIRKDCANHVRETMQYSRNTNNCMERLAIYRLYHNYFKRYRIEPGKREQRSHGEVAGVGKGAIHRELSTMFRARRMLSKTRLSFSDALIWLRGLATAPGRPGIAWCPAYSWD